MFAVGGIFAGPQVVILHNMQGGGAVGAAVESGPFITQRAGQKIVWVPEADIMGRVIEPVYSFGVKSNYSLAFDGIDGHMVATGVPVNGLANLSVSFWIKTAAVTGYVFSIPFLSSSANGVDYRSTLDGRWIVKTSGGSVDFASGCNTSDNAWHHVGFTYDGVTVRAYCDGAAANTAALTGTISTSAGGEVNLGRFGSAGSYAAVTMDDVRLYSTAVSATDMMNLFAGRKVNAGLIAYWAAEEGSGTSVADSGGYNGTLNGGSTWSSDIASPIA